MKNINLLDYCEDLRSCWRMNNFLLSLLLVTFSGGSVRDK